MVRWKRIRDEEGDEEEERMSRHVYTILEVSVVGQFARRHPSFLTNTPHAHMPRGNLEAKQGTMDERRHLHIVVCCQGVSEVRNRSGG